MDSIIGYRQPNPAAQPPNNSPLYRSTGLRHPSQPSLIIPQGLTETRAPRFSPLRYPPLADLTLKANGKGHAMGERIIVAGRVLDEDGRPQANTMVEVWQANAAGRYNHEGDQHDAPLDPDFHGMGRVFTDADGWYRYVTIRPGAYPWGNHHNAWRPVHIHYSMFGAGYAQRLITQMYFEGDPLLKLDPIFNTVSDPAARDRLVANFDLDITAPDTALGYRFDIILRGRDATPMEENHHHD